MSRAPQKRRIETRQKLKSAAEAIVARDGFAGLRVEEVVASAGVAKGTFFAHFTDKDRLMAELVGERMAEVWQSAMVGPAPRSVAEICDRLVPLMQVMASERDVFDLIMRYSGATRIEEETLISQNFIDQIMTMINWIEPLRGQGVRADVETDLLADGVQAFLVQAIALEFCMVHSDTSADERLRAYLKAWLAPGTV